MKVTRYITRYELRQFLNHNKTLVELIQHSDLSSKEKAWCSKDDDKLPIEIIIPDGK